MGNIPNAGGTTTSFTNAPQAAADYYTLSEENILNSTYYTGLTKTLTLDVMSNDLGGNAKSLFSIDDSEGNAITDLAKTDLLSNTKNSNWERTDDGNWIRIFNGKVEFKLADPEHPDDASYARDINSLGGTEVVDDKFTYAIKLGNGTLSYATVYVNIAGANDLATISGTEAGNVIEAGGVNNAIAGTSTASGTLIVSDVDSGEATFQAASQAALQGVYGKFTFSEQTGQWTYTLDNARTATQGLAQDAAATDTLVVTSLDGSASRTITVNITGTNDAPVITSAAQSGIVSEGDDGSAMSASGQVTSSDVDVGDSQTFSVTAAATHGSASVDTDGTWHYTAIESGEVDQLAEGEHLADSFTVTVDDGHGGIASQVVTIDIVGTNDAPSGAATAVLTAGSEDVPYVVQAADLLEGFTDVDGDELKVTDLTADHGTVIDNGDDTFTVTPEANYNGAVTLTYTVSDGHTGGTIEASLSFTLNAVVDLTALDDSFSGSEDQPVNGSLANDTTTSGGTLTYVQASDPTHGTVTVNPDGTFTYNPAANYYGTDSFTYTVTDAAANETATQTVHVALAAVNDAATITGNTAASISEDAVPDKVSGDLMATDVDNPADLWAPATGSTAHGSYSIDEQGVWEYTLNNANAEVQALGAGSSPLTDTFTVATVDGTAQEVTITINGADEPITAITRANVETGTGDTNDRDTDFSASAVATQLVNFTDANGAHTIQGSNLADTISLGNGSDAAYGHDGDDVIRGEGGADTSLYGQAGNDTLAGGQAGDALYGGSGDDRLFGYESPTGGANDSDANDAGDAIYGGSGSDHIYGQSGADTIIGGFGADELWGHGGADTFTFVDIRDRGDVIKDFSNAAGDRLDLAQIDSNSANPGNDLFAWGSTTATAHGLWYQYDAGSNVTHVYGDTDGTVGTAEIWFDLAGNANLDAAHAAGLILL